MSRRPWSQYRGFGPGFAAVILALGFLVAAGFLQERLRERQLPTRAEELGALVEDRRDTIAALSRELSTVSDRLAALQDREARGSAEVGELARELDRLRAPVGLEGVRGPGIVVELADSTRAPQTRADQTDLRIQDVDVQLVVNELWRAGAEAVSVNGQRVVSTTAIRRAGGSILINFRAVSSPYRIAAIGDAGALQRSLTDSPVSDRFTVWEQVYGLGFAVRPQEDLAVPSVAVPRLRWAQPTVER